MIVETVIRDGRTKDYRIFNLTTNTIYSSSFETEQEAIDAIENGTKRDGVLVKFVPLKLIHEAITSW
jgi:hypothetical protein